MFSREARIYQGAIQVSPDTGNVGSYQDIMVNKSGSVLLQRRFTMWRRVDNGSGSATAPRVQVVSFNITFSINLELGDCYQCLWLLLCHQVRAGGFP